MLACDRVVFWHRMKTQIYSVICPQILALNGNKPIRLVSHGNTIVQPPVFNSNDRVVNANGGTSANVQQSKEHLRRLKIARIRRLRQQRLLRLKSTTTTTTLPPTTTPVATTPGTTTPWYDSWQIAEGQSSTPGDFTDSFLDFNYEYKIDDY